MADIAVRCGECGAETSISEYVDPEMAKCRACGVKLSVPNIAPAGPKPPPPREKAPEGPSPLERSTMTAFRAAHARRERVRKRKRIISWTPSLLTIWLIFIIGIILLGLLRFVLLGQSDREFIVKGALAALLVLHFTVVVDAFADNIMTGLLCLFIPFYSLFYLYTMCDSYILRLSVGILGVPFGLDAALATYKAAEWVIMSLRKAAMFEDY
ncbi:MAG: hypothetical protein WCL44_01305 [bacterium]